MRAFFSHFSLELQSLALSEAISWLELRVWVETQIKTYQVDYSKLGNFIASASGDTRSISI